LYDGFWVYILFLEAEKQRSREAEKRRKVDMGLIKYKSFEDARRGALQELLTRSANRAHVVRIDDLILSRSYYPKGLYRFKSWDEARKSDLQFMIRSSLRRRNHD